MVSNFSSIVPNQSVLNKNTTRYVTVSYTAVAVTSTLRATPSIYETVTTWCDFHGRRLLSSPISILYWHPAGVLSAVLRIPHSWSPQRHISFAGAAEETAFAGSKSASQASWRKKTIPRERTKKSTNIHAFPNSSTYSESPYLRYYKRVIASSRPIAGNNKKF